MATSKTTQKKRKAPEPKDSSAAEVATAPAKPRSRAKPPIDYAAAVCQAFLTNERINQYLLEHLDASIWDADAPVGKGRTIRAIVAHIHNVRHMWLVVSAKDSPAPDKVDRATLTLAEAKHALAASAAAMSELLKRSCESGGHVKDFKPDVVGFLGYAIAHESHHRGQICMLARLLGRPLPQAAGYGMWEWNKRGQEVSPG